MNSSKSISKKKAKQQHLRCNLCSKAHVFPLGVKRVFLKTKTKKQIQYIRCYLSICKQSNQHFFCFSLTHAGSAPPSGWAGELFLFDSNSLPPKCKAELTAPFQTHPFFRITQRPHIKMDGTFGIKMQNLHCIGRSAARTDKNGCKHTDNDWLVIRKAVPKFVTLQRFVLIFCKNGHKVVWLYNLVSKWS